MGLLKRKLGKREDKLEKKNLQTLPEMETSATERSVQTLVINQSQGDSTQNLSARRGPAKTLSGAPRIITAASGRMDLSITSVPLALRHVTALQDSLGPLRPGM